MLLGYFACVMLGAIMGVMVMCLCIVASENNKNE